MTHPTHPTHPTPASARTDLHRLHDEAHARADALRRAARDDFWRGADAWLGTAADKTRRAASRLLYRLQRRNTARCTA